jgi:hypothetical protein
MALTEREKMLGVALYMHKVKKETTIEIMMLLDTDDDIDDMTWYMGQHPNATDEELLAVANQLVKDRKGN